MKTNHLLNRQIIWIILLITSLPGCRNNMSSKEDAEQPRIVFLAGDIYIGNTKGSDDDGGEYFVMDSSGNNVRNLGWYFGSPSWSKDGKLLALGCNNEDFNYLCILDPSLKTDIRQFPWNFDRADILQRIELPEVCKISGGGLRIVSSSWSPEGDRIAVICSDKEDINISHICMLSRNDQSSCWDQDYIQNPARIDWSPKDNLLAISGGPIAENQIWLVSPNGSDWELVSDGFAPAWSKDGKKIAYIQKGWLSILDVSTKNVTRVIRREEYLFEDRTGNLNDLNLSDCGDLGDSTCRITWSPDDKSLLFSSSYMDMSTIIMFKIALDSGTITIPFPMSRSEFEPDWGIYPVK